MSAAGHYLEKEGIATTGISLVRPNTEQLRPPRFLWVPFELGRPFGAPDEPAFQTKVARAALALLERDDGPVLLEDFPEDAPGGPSGDMSGWVCPVPLPKPDLTAESEILQAALDEVAKLAPWYAVAAETRGRTTVGVSGLEIEAALRFLNAFLEHEDAAPENQVADVTLGEALRLACEDVRSWYLEAATARPGAAKSRELADWFWGDTAAGRLFLALHAACAESTDARVRHVGASQLVPRIQRHRLPST